MSASLVLFPFTNVFAVTRTNTGQRLATFCGIGNNKRYETLMKRNAQLEDGIPAIRAAHLVPFVFAGRRASNKLTLHPNGSKIRGVD